MSEKQKLYVVGVVAFWGALLYAIGWGLVSWLTAVPATYIVTVEMLSVSIVVNRWLDVLLFPIYLNLILSVYLWLIPALEKTGISRDDLGAGLVAGLGIGLVAGLGIGLVAGLGIGLVAGLGIGLVAGLTLLIKAIVEMHKRAFKTLS